MQELKQFPCLEIIFILAIYYYLATQVKKDRIFLILKKFLIFKIRKTNKNNINICKASVTNRDSFNNF